MRKTITVCDRCGDVTDNKCVIVTTWSLSNTRDEKREGDLCANCETSYRDWWIGNGYKENLTA